MATMHRDNALDKAYADHLRKVADIIEGGGYLTVDFNLDRTYPAMRIRTASTPITATLSLRVEFEDPAEAPEYAEPV